jgi:hypothetical protein
MITPMKYSSVGIPIPLDGSGLPRETEVLVPLNLGCTSVK